MGDSLKLLRCKQTCPLLPTKEEDCSRSEEMANPNQICAVTINEFVCDGSVRGEKFWAQVVPIADPRMNRPRYDIDLVSTWVPGVEFGEPTMKYLKRRDVLERRRERRERRRAERELAREAEQQAAMDGQGQQTEGDEQEGQEEQAGVQGALGDGNSVEVEGLSPELQQKVRVVIENWMAQTDETTKFKLRFRECDFCLICRSKRRHEDGD